MFFELSAGLGNAVAFGVSAAAVERPVVDGQLTADKSRGLVVALRAAQRYVRLARTEIAHRLRRVEVDADVRMFFMKLAQQWCEQGDGVDLFRRNLDRSADVARL